MLVCPSIAPINPFERQRQGNPVQQKQPYLAVSTGRAMLALWIVLAISGCEPRTQPGTLPASDGEAPSTRIDTETTESTQTNTAASQTPGPTQPVGHRRMLGLLQKISDRTPDEHIFLGEYRGNRLRQALKSLPSDATPLNRLRLHFALGIAESWLGNEIAAIEQLEAAYNLLPKVQGQIDSSQANDVIYRLGLAHMRYGETQNCCLLNSPESCILPIRGKAIHTNQQGSRKAIQYFLELLELSSGKHLEARWLLNIAYMTIDGYPDDIPTEYRIPFESFAAKTEFPLFRNVAPSLGVNKFNQAGSVVVDDFNQDGYLDILASTWDTTHGMHFFVNQHDGKFVERTTEAGLTGLLSGINMVQADYDNDGDLDVFVLRGAWLGEKGRHPNSLLRNNGDSTFTDVTFETGLGEVHYPSHSAAWADYDNDGDLDLYVGNENLYRGDRKEIYLSQATPSQLFQNNGDGSFSDVALQAGVQNMAFAKGVVWGDYDGDRFPDLYVSNFGSLNRLYHNNGDGSFTNVAIRLDVDRPLKSFPAWFWDFDNDGILDLYVPSSNWQSGGLRFLAQGYLGLPVEHKPPRLYRGDGQGGFDEVAEKYGLSRIAFPMGANFGDLDNDGFLDFYLGTGYPDYEALMPNLMFRNQEGQGFEDVTAAGGFGHLQKGHGIAFADLDHDGDQDVFAQMGGAYRGDKFSDALFENPGFDNHWISVDLIGVQSNRSAIGARLRVVIEEHGSERSIYKHVNSGASFGANPLRQTIGLGKASRIVRLEIFWPTTGKTQIVNGLPMDCAVQITEDKRGFKQFDRKPFALRTSNTPE